MTNPPAKPAPPQSFTARLLQRVVRAAAEDHADNLDKWNDAVLGRPSLRAETGQGQAFNEILPQELARYVPLIPQLDRLSDRLDDDASRDLLAMVIAYRMMGRQAVRLPLNTPDYWAAVEQVAARAQPSAVETSYKVAGTNIGTFALDQIDMRPDGFDVSLLSRPAAAVTQFCRLGYRCDDLGVMVRPGDVVLDCGACWGESTLHAALDAGPEGRVFAVEFEPSNLAIVRRAIALNPHLAPRIEVVARALWDVSDTVLRYSQNGPGSRLLPAGTDKTDTAPETETLTIDDFVEDAGLDRLDVLKLNVTGSEPWVLRGAETTITRFRPKLILNVSFQPRHIVELPRVVDELVPEYRFRLGHNSMRHADTVLFAAVP